MATHIAQGSQELFCKTFLHLNKIKRINRIFRMIIMMFSFMCFGITQCKRGNPKFLKFRSGNA